MAFHAAKALIVDRTGKVAKSHSGVRTEFARLTRAAHLSNRPLLSFLAQAYRYKESSDYAVGLEAIVTSGEIDRVIETARRFLTFVTALLEADSASS